MSVASLTGTRMAGISRGRTFRRGASIAALLVAGWCWVALATPAEGASSGKRLVVAPREGAKLPARSLTIKVRAGRKAVLRARLNGKAIGRYFSRRPCRGVRRLNVSASHGLRHRRNVLRVRVRRPGARRARVATVHFRVATNRPLAAAGVDRTVAVHARLRLDGGRSRLHPPVRRRGAGLDYRWRLLRAPPASELRTHGRNPNSAAGPRVRKRVKNLGPDALFSRRGSRTPRFRADYPGLYRFRLTVKAPDGATGVDDVRVPVTSEPLVPIDTMAKPPGQNSWGVRVGEHFYPDPGNSQKWLQLVVLKPETLEPIPSPMANKAYDCPEATQNPYVDRSNAVNRCTQAVNSDLAQLKKDYPNERLVVIGVSQKPDNLPDHSEPKYGVQPPVGLPNALAPIGGRAIAPDRWANRDQPMLRGTMSVVGFLGSKVAEGTNNLNLDLAEEQRSGRICGYLLRDNWGLYSSFASGEHVPFDTQAPGSTATHNVMRIGDQTFTADLPGGSFGGFHVVILDRQSLEGKSYFFETAAGLKGFAQLEWMIDTISHADNHRHGALVFIATVGDTHLGFTDLNDTAKQLVDLLSDRVGGTRTRAYGVLDPPQSAPKPSYSLVAELGTPRAEGVEAEGSMRNGLNGVPLVGSLTRSDRDYGFELEPSGVGEDFDSFAGPSAKLRDLALSDPGDWPEQGNATRTAAIGWVGEQVGIDSSRSYFWTQAYNPGALDLKSKKLAELDYKDVPPSFQQQFAEADLNWAKTELGNEIDWFKAAHGFIATIAEPITNTQLQQWAVFDKIQKDINGLVTIPAENRVLSEIGLVLKASVEGAGELLEPLGVGVGLVSAIYDAVDEWGKLSAGGDDIGEPFSVAAGNLGVQLTTRMKDAQDTITKQMFDVIAADYRKLRTVGLCSSLPAQCPDPPATAWEVSQLEQTRAEKSATDGAQVATYSALLPAKYQLWAFDESPNRSTTWRGVDGQIHQPAGQNIGGWWCPFHDSPATAQYAYPVRKQLGQFGDPNAETWQVAALGNRTGEGTFTNHYQMELPPAQVTDPLFNTLGAHPETFFQRSFENVSRFAQFPEQTSQTRWISETDPPGIRTNTC
jgi:hypothetical protein